MTIIQGPPSQAEEEIMAAMTTEEISRAYGRARAKGRSYCRTDPETGLRLDALKNELFLRPINTKRDTTGKKRTYVTKHGTIATMDTTNIGPVSRAPRFISRRNARNE